MHVFLCFTNKQEGNGAHVSNALEHFRQHPAFHFHLYLPQRVGLGYTGQADESQCCQYCKPVKQTPTLVQKLCDCTGSTQLMQIFLPYI